MTAKRKPTSLRGKAKHPEILPYLPPALRGASATKIIEAALDVARRGGELTALHLLAAALETSPRHPQGHLLRLDLLRKLGPEKDLNAWLGSLRAMYERAEATPPMVLELAFAEERLGDLDAALDHFQEVVALGAVRAAHPQHVELAHGGVLRTEAALAKRAAEAAEEEPEEAPVRPASKSSRRRAMTPPPGTPRAGQAAPAGAGEAGPPRATSAALSGRGSMQLASEERPEPVELQARVETLPLPASLDRRLAAGDYDPAVRYRLAEEAWRWGAEWLVRPRPAGEGTSASGPAAPPEPKPLAPSALERPHVALAARTVLDRLHGRALLTGPLDDLLVDTALATLRLLVARGQGRRVLVLAPAPLLPLWQRELHGALGALLPATTPDAAAAGQSGLLLLDAPTADSRSEELQRWAPEIAVVDQAQQAASYDSRLSRLIQQLAAPRLLLLTSTPVVSDLLSLHGLVSLVRPGLLDGVAAFRRTHVGKNEPWVAQDAPALRSLLAGAALWLAPGVEESAADEQGSPLTLLSWEPAPAPGQGAALPQRVERLLTLLADEPGPGRCLGRDRALVDAVQARLMSAGRPGWQAVADDDPLPTVPDRVRLAVHLDLPAHPVGGALRAERAVGATRQLLLLPDAGVEALLAGLGAGVTGLPARPGARTQLRPWLRTRETHSPLELLTAAWEEGGAPAAQRLAEELPEELARARELVERSAERSAALWADPLAGRPGAPGRSKTGLDEVLR